MLDYFISYSTHDQEFADRIHLELKNHGLNGFIASTSLRPGQPWPQEIIDNLKQSSWVIFLASEAACQSSWVQQELGIAIGASKRLVPIVWDMDPSKLPGWVSHNHAINLKDATVEQLKARMATIAEEIKEEKIQGWIILGGLIVALMLLGKNG
jgi:TIR domain